LDAGNPEKTASGNRTGKRAGRRARGLAPLDRDGIWHCHGTVRAGGRSVRVRKSLGLPVARVSEDAALDECRRQESEIIAEVTGQTTPGAYLSVAANDYLTKPRERPLGKTTVDIVKEIARIFGLRRLNEISEDEWHRHVDQRQKGNSAATRERYLNALLSFLKFCLGKKYRLECLPEFERDKRARNPNRRARRRVRELRPDLVARLMMAAHITIRAQMAVEWSTGARVSSVLHGCRVCDLILAEGREQITFHDTKNGESVDAALHPTAARILRDYVKWRGRLHEREAPLFLTHRKKPYRDTGGAWGGQNKTGFNAAKRRAAEAVLEEAGERAGQEPDKQRRQQILEEARADAQLLRSVTQHWFRHMLASRMLRDGDIRAAMEQGGWLDMRSVIGYAHDVPEFRRSVVSKFDDFGRSLTRDEDDTELNN
jgi:integrase